MPPAQCPECGRFLARAFVQDLVTDPAPCPKCGVRLSPASFPDELGPAATPDGPDEEPAAAAELRHGDTTGPDDPASVRPPDLDPGEVRLGGDGRDPLEGWDTTSADVVELDHFRAERRPPPDGVIIAGAGMAGALVGALVSRRRGAGAAAGLAAGVTAAAVARQVWRLPD